MMSNYPPLSTHCGHPTPLQRGQVVEHQQEGLKMSVWGGSEERERGGGGGDREKYSIVFQHLAMPLLKNQLVA